MSAKTAEGIPLGSTGPHPVQPLPDKPRFGHAVSEADLHLAVELIGSGCAHATAAEILL